jgi:hypothetical protein
MKQKKDDARREIHELIVAHGGRVGQVAGLQRENLTRRELAKENGMTVYAVHYSDNQIKAVKTGRCPESSEEKALGLMRRLKEEGKSQLSPKARALLERNYDQLHLKFESSQPPKDSRKPVVDHLADLEGVSGVYVAAYSGYLNKSEDPALQFALYKIGYSKNVAERIKGMSGGTTHPEPLTVMRVFAVPESDPKKMEGSLHKILKTAGHLNPDGKKQRAREWFKTSLEFIDLMAFHLKMETVHLSHSDSVKSAAKG